MMSTCREGLERREAGVSKKPISTNVLCFPEHLPPRPTLSECIKTLEDKFGYVEIVDSSTLKACDAKFPITPIVKIENGFAQWYLEGWLTDDIPVGEPIKTSLRCVDIKGRERWTPNKEYFTQLVLLKKELEGVNERIDSLIGEL